jgi:hypothetical protein
MDQTGAVEGFVAACGRHIENGAGRRFLLRGVGLGGWLLPEGYMWCMPDGADRPRRIERLVSELVGPEEAARFWEACWDSYITEADVKRIADEGFNSVRLPINARYLTGSDHSGALLESRVTRIDRFIEWCRQHRLYVILDLHGAPGGQTGTNIDDSAFDRPDLFLDAENQERTVEIWRTLAERYRDEWIVAGYDLLNEPLPNWFSQYNDRVLPLYRRITEAIRRVDQRHMIILEGVHWATDWSVFTERIDHNVMLQFHKYWNNPDRESLEPYLSVRDAWKVPIFMGEGGENNCDWYTGAFRLFEDLDISWNFWTWKKLDTTNSPASIQKPEGWEEIVAFAEGEAPPDPLRTKRILSQFLANLPLDRCDYHGDVVRALFRRAPVRIPAIFYAFEDRGEGYGLPPRAWAGPPAAKTVIPFRRGDGLHFGYVHNGSDPQSVEGPPNFQHNHGEPWDVRDWIYLQLDPGAWVAYDFSTCPQLSQETSHELTVRLACAGSVTPAQVTVLVDQPEQEIPVQVGTCGTAFHDYAMSLQCAPGTRRIVLRADTASIRLQWLCVRMMP